MSRTAQQLIDIVQSRIGNRVDGVIGARSVDDVLLDCCNDAIYTIVEQDDTNAIRSVRRKTSIDVTTDDYSYALPTTDEDDETIRIRSVLNATAFELDDDQGWKLIQLSQSRRDLMFPFTNDSITGRPNYYTIYGNNFEVYPFPDDSYTINLRVSIWPERIAVNEEHPLGSEFDKTIADYMTFDVFRTLQLTEDAQFWGKAFGVSLASAMGANLREPDYSPSGEKALYLPSSTDPALDPFVKRNA